MTNDEQKVHMALWCVTRVFTQFSPHEISPSLSGIFPEFSRCIMKAPLLIGCDLVNIKDEALQILSNTEAIAINQDPLGVAGRLVQATNQYHIWSGDNLIFFRRIKVFHILFCKFSNSYGNFTQKFFAVEVSEKIQDLCTAAPNHL